MNAKHLWTVCFLCSSALWPAAVEAEDGLGEARRLLMSGKYAEAAELYAPEAEKNPAAALGLARCLEATGKLEDAVRTLQAAGDHAVLHAELARLAFASGDYPAATRHVEGAIKLDSDQLLARWIAGELHRTAGRLDEAEAAYRWMVEHYNANEVKDAESLRWIGLAAARHARWNRLNDQFRFLVNELYPEALELQPDYWPAHYESGLLFLEKYNQADATRQLKSALELNPHAAEVHAALARLALENRDIEQARASIDRALEINPRLLAGWLGKADLAWANFRPREAAGLLEKNALPLNPVCQRTLGRLAACYLLSEPVRKPVPRDAARGLGRGGSGRFARLVDQVTSRNPHAGEFFFTLADRLEARNKLPEAERFFHRTIEVMPRKIGPRSRLGLIAMRCGREDRARELLDEAFAVDPFNQRVNNMLLVLEVLDSMETLRTEHFVLKFDRSRDKLLGRYAARHLEAIYPELCEQFGYRPPDKPLVEIFSQASGRSGQEWFSTRMTGLPYLGAVGACAGKMVGMTSPNDGSSAGKFNWVRVLRHELVHVITLQQTDFNIPHWYTEGLAVYSEGYPRPQSWNKLLARRVAAGKLFNLRSINFGFIRPHSSDDWQLAYCQAELYVQHMQETYGPDTPRKLLSAYAEGLTTPEAIQRVFGVSAEEFDEGYLAYVKKIVAELDKLRWPGKRSLAKLLQAQRDHPKDADLAAELAYAYAGRGADREAAEMAQRALKLKPKHQLAAYVMARLHVQAERPQRAVELLDGCLDPQSPQPNALNLLAQLKLKAKDYDEAARLYALGRRHDPHDLKWLRALARVYLLSENHEKLAELLARLADAEADDLTVRKKLAELALARKDYAAAADWARRALEIDVTDAEVHRVFAEALSGRHNWGEAIREFRTALELNPDETRTRFGLVRAYCQAGQTQKALATLEALLELDSDYPGAKPLYEKLQETEKP